MKRLSQVLSGLALIAALGATPVVAQGAEFSLGGGLGLPLGDFDDVSKLGWHGLAGISFIPSGSPVGIQVDGQYHQYKLDEDVVVSDDLKSRLIFGTANAVYKFNSSEGTRFRPYLIGGGGVYNLKVTGDDDVGGVIDTEGSTTKFGINAGAGFDFKAGGAGLFVEGRFHNVFTEGSNTTFIPITVGVRFGGN